VIISYNETISLSVVKKKLNKKEGAKWRTVAVLYKILSKSISITKYILKKNCCSVV